ncbi:hypothetical protein FQR65_LT14986 [Abscondita terminalis]|nr:hypothetical protein FQR65_LT14986 [Abscondita terminalis]
MPYSEISAAVKDMASRAKNKGLKANEMEGSTFSISNLGMYVGSIIEKPVVKNGQIVVGNTMKLSLACDHRVIDGVTGAQFLETLRTYLENPLSLLQGETFPELAAKFNTTTTRLAQLNGNGIKFHKRAGYKAEQTEPCFNPDFEKKLTIAAREFLKKNAASGIVFNSVGVNGATYADFLKYPLQLEELKQVNPDVVMISLGTNESLSTITKEEFQKSAQDLIQAFRKDNPTLPILLISPTDNKLKGDRIQEIVSWIKEISTQNNTAFLNMYEATGGKGYFVKSLARKEANGDGVRFF